MDAGVWPALSPSLHFYPCNIFLYLHHLNHQVSSKSPLYSLHNLDLSKKIKHLIIFSYLLYHFNITNLIIFNVHINKVTRNLFWTVTPLHEQSFHIDTFGFDIFNNFGNTKSTVQYNSLPWSKYRSTRP